jgi:hypothetical protein
VLSDVHTPARGVQWPQPSYSSSLKEIKKSHTKTYKIYLVDDSHIRDCSEMLANCLGSLYGVFGISKSNANLNAITSIIYFETENFANNDLVTICGSSKDTLKMIQKQDFVI